MRGDFSRIRFEPAKQYTAVLQQQGRVALDADANEQCAIYDHLRDTANVDLIGRVGGPAGDAGFKIVVTADGIFITPGRYYVDGILTENLSLLHYDNQPYLDTSAQAARELLLEVLRVEGASAQFMLEVWERLVIDLDDPCLREPALGQADTTARLQTVWRVVGTLHHPRLPSSRDDTRRSPNDAVVAQPVRNLPVPAGCPNALQDPIEYLSSCCQQLYRRRRPPHTGAMGADTGTPSDDCGCQPVPSAGYRGLENQLYRVEIHRGGDLSTATFKWSRENGSVVTQITDVNGSVLTVSGLGPDVNLGFAPGQWVELSDDTYLFGIPPNRPGGLYQIYGVQQSTLQVTLTAPVTGIDTNRNARMRRWDQSGAAATVNGVPLSGTPVQLENGIEVTFRTGEYYPGDYWTIAARTPKGEIEWPPCGAEPTFFQPPLFTVIHTAPVACVHPNRNADIERQRATVASAEEILYPDMFLTDDCRLLFPPLTALCGGATSSALHVQATSWNNDDVMTVDTLLETGLSITLDQAPSCPWNGANFRVTLETPFVSDWWSPVAAGGAGPTDIFLRTELVLDPPAGITVSGSQVNWLLPMSPPNDLLRLLWDLLNAALVVAKVPGYGRVRVHLDGGAVYANGASGNVYLDGQSFGSTGQRVGDGSPCIQLDLPSGTSARASDFDGWFYLAPTVVVASVIIQGVEGGATTEVPISAVRLMVNDQNQIIGMQIGETLSVANLQALVTLSYAPIAQTPVTLTLSGVNPSVANIAALVNVLPGQTTATAALNVTANPGPGTYTLTLSATVATALGNFGPTATLSITGAPIPGTPGG
jgi:hypothetical protein